MKKEGKRRGGLLLNLLLLLCFAIFCVAAWKLWGYWKNYHGGKEEYEELRKYTEETTEKEKQAKKDTCPITVDFDALSKVNPDVKAWIYIEGTGINYPVVQTEDNSYYLHRTFEKKDSFIGAIFLDAGCKEDFTSDNSIVYGHNLKNGEMFGMLKKHYDVEFNEEADYKEHQKIWIVTPRKEREYQLFAAREIDVNEDADVYTIEFGSDEEKAAYIETAKAKSQYKIDTKVDEDNPLLTLSTCTSSSEAGRFIIQATEIQTIERKSE